MLVAPPLSSSVTVTGLEPCSSAKTWLPVIVPAPFASTTVALLVVPSPQLTLAVCVSSTPSSVNVVWKLAVPASLIT